MQRDLLDQVFETWWPQLRRSLDKIATIPGIKMSRPDRELLEEVLTLVRISQEDNRELAKSSVWRTVYELSGAEQQAVPIEILEDYENALSQHFSVLLDTPGTMAEEVFAERKLNQVRSL